MGKPAPEKEIKLSRQNQPKIPRPSPNAEFVQRLNDGSTGSNQKIGPYLRTRCQYKLAPRSCFITSNARRNVSITTSTSSTQLDFVRCARHVFVLFAYFWPSRIRMNTFFLQPICLLPIGMTINFPLLSSYDHVVPD